MHTIPELGSGVPAFLAKLWKLVEDPETDDLICWSPNGRSFFIRNQAQFARELLPHYYKHNNMASFVRQLNMYGFHKKVSVELGGLKCDRDEMEFAHQFFCKGHPYLVEHIKRKIASSKGQDPALAPIKPELMNKMLTEVRSMRGRQEHLDSRLGAMKRENEALWRELAMLRQKHLKQQQIVNKLIHFLITLVQPSRSGGLSVKRRYPLMIDDSNRPRSKQSKLSKPQASPTGPVIHELDASEPDLDSQYIVAEMLDNQNPAIESPEHNDVNAMEDDSMETIHFIEDSESLQDNLQSVNPKETDTKKKRGFKGKKKRKNKVPVKILIPSTDNEGEPREETHLYEMPLDDSGMTIQLLDNKPLVSKAIPVATLRSSKLAAMAANMKKCSEVDTELDLEMPGEDENDIQENDPELVKLEDILIVPEMINQENSPNVENGEFLDNGNATDNEGTIGPEGEMGEIVDASSVAGLIKRPSSRFDQLDAMGGNDQQDNQGVTNANATEGLLKEDKSKGNEAGTSAPKDLSLSCVNPPGISDPAYRLAPVDEMDTHLETMQSELDNLRDILRGEGYSIDANTLLGLFAADDPMAFSMPVNPELNPHCEKDDNDQQNGGDSLNGANGGELMAYNPAPSLLDFDDDIFLGAASSSPVTGPGGDSGPNSLYATDPLDLEDNKTSLLESLVANEVNNGS